MENSTRRVSLAPSPSSCGLASSLSSISPQTSRCEDCGKAAPILSCNSCELFMCLDCAERRHSLGNLKFHGLQFVVLHKENDSKAAQNCCQLCEVSNIKDIVFCLICNILFCQECASTFHDKGTLSGHKALGKWITDINEIQTRRVEDKKIQRNKSLSEEQFNSAFSAVLKPTDIVTFKIVSFGISTSLQSLLEMSQDRHKDNLWHRSSSKSILISIDCRSQMLKIFDKSSASSFEFSRHFSMLHSAKVSSADPRHLSISFKHNQITADCYAQNGVEATQIAQHVNQLRKKENLEFLINEPDSLLPSNDEFIIYRGMCVKKGKIAPSPRWIIVREHVMEFYRSPGDSFPSTAFSLLGLTVSRLERGALLLRSPDKNAEIRFESTAEREILFSILQDLSGLKDADLNDQFDHLKPGLYRRKKSQLSRNLSQTSSGKKIPLPIDRFDSSGRSEEEEADSVFIQSFPKPGNGNIFILMRLLRKSLEDEAQLTPNLRIPKEVWQQKDVKLPAFTQKNQQFSLIAQQLENAAKIDPSDADQFLKMLADLTECFQVVQNNLAQHLTYIHAVKKKPKIPTTTMGKFGANLIKYGHSLKKGVQRATASVKVLSDNSYVLHISQILIAVEVIETWEKELDKEILESINDVLNRIKEFFREVFCTIVLSDLRQFCKKYIKDYIKKLTE